MQFLSWDELVRLERVSAYLARLARRAAQPRVALAGSLDVVQVRSRSPDKGERFLRGWQSRFAENGRLSQTGPSPPTPGQPPAILLPPTGAEAASSASTSPCGTLALLRGPLPHTTSIAARFKWPLCSVSRHFPRTRALDCKVVSPARLELLRVAFPRLERVSAIQITEKHVRAWSEPENLAFLFRARELEFDVRLWPLGIEAIAASFVSLLQHEASTSRDAGHSVAPFFPSLRTLKITCKFSTQCPPTLRPFFDAIARRVESLSVEGIELTHWLLPLLDGADHLRHLELVLRPTRTGPDSVLGFALERFSPNSCFSDSNWTTSWNVRQRQALEAILQHPRISCLQSLALPRLCSSTAPGMGALAGLRHFPLRSLRFGVYSPRNDGLEDLTRDRDVGEPDWLGLRRCVLAAAVAGVGVPVFGGPTPPSSTFASTLRALSIQFFEPCTVQPSLLAVNLLPCLGELRALRSFELRVPRSQSTAAVAWPRLSTGVLRFFQQLDDLTLWNFPVSIASAVEMRVAVATLLAPRASQRYPPRIRSVDITLLLQTVSNGGIWNSGSEKSTPFSLPDALEVLASWCLRRGVERQLVFPDLEVEEVEGPKSYHLASVRLPSVRMLHSSKPDHAFDGLRLFVSSVEIIDQDRKRIVDVAGWSPAGGEGSDA